jgi:cytochrome c oxidase assembly factor CtaG
MIPWIIMAVVAVPLVVIAFVAVRRKTAAGELLASDEEEARTEQEFAEAEAYEARWREEDKEKFHQERLP